MTNYNERLDDVLLHTGVGNCGNPFCDKPNIGVDEAKQAIISLIKELVAEAKPANPYPEGTNSRAWEQNRIGFNEAIEQFEQNLLKALSKEK